MPARRAPEETDRLRQDLLRHARALVYRDGAGALTMRSLAAEAGCAVGLPYKVFADRGEIVAALIGTELDELSSALSSWLEGSEEHTVAENLDGFASIVLDTRMTALFHAGGDGWERLAKSADLAERTSSVVASLDSSVAEYLRAEQRRGRVRDDADAGALGFLIAGAVHNLVWAGAAYPRPSRAELGELLARTAATVAAHR